MISKMKKISCNQLLLFLPLLMFIKFIRKVVEAEKSFLVSYIIKILTEQRLLKYLEADSDLSEMN